jgi:hypothetical protein
MKRITKGWVVAVVAAVGLLGAGVRGAAADVLYTTDFEPATFSTGTINGQDSWFVTGGNGGGDIVDVGGAHGQVLDVFTPDGSGWGNNVGRAVTNSTKQYVQILMDFSIAADGSFFWFMDNRNVGGSVIAALDWEGSAWGSQLAYNDATPTHTTMPWTAGTWYRFGMEVDMQTGLIVGANLDGTWQDVTDDAGLGAVTYDAFVWGQYSESGVGHLYIDNLSFTDSDAKVSPEPATMVLFGLGSAGLTLIRRRRA